MRELSLINTSKKALVDDTDYERCNLVRWRLKSREDGIIKATSPQVSIQRYIMKDKINFYDHIDRNIFNNQRSNLRLAKHDQNCANRSKAEGDHTSEYKGLDWYKPRGMWRIRVKKVHVGLFKNEKEAALAYNKKAIEVFGEFACLNKVNQ